MPADAKVGLVVVIAVILFIGLAVWLTGAVQARNTYTVTVHFRDTQGIQPGSPVRLAGVSIGKVEKVELRPSEDFPDKPAVLTLRLEEPQNPENKPSVSDIFTIETGTLLGEKYVSVTKAVREEERRIKVAQGSELEGYVAGSVPDLLSDSRDLVRTLTDVAVALDNALGDERVLGNVDTMLSNFARASADAQRMIASLARVTGAREGSLNRTLGNFEAMSENFSRASADLASIARSGEIPGEAGTAVTRLREAAEDIREITTHLRDVTTGQLTGDRVDEILANVQEVSERAVEVSEAIAEAVEQSQDLIAEGTEVAASANRLLDRVDRRLERTSKATADIHVDPRIELTVGLDGGDLQLDTDLFFRKGDSPSQFVLGLRDVGSGDRLNLQYARQVNDRLRLRGGLIAGDVGAAADYSLGGPWSVTLEGYEQRRDFRVDLTGAYRWRDGMSGLFGVDNLFSDVDVFVGGRMEW